MRLLDPMDCAPCASICEAAPAGSGPVCAAPALQQPQAAAQPAAPGPHYAFLQSWRNIIAPKLQQLLTLLAGQEVAQSCAIAQIWTYLPVLIEGRQILKAEQLCLLGDGELQTFHADCAQQGVTVSQLGPMGKVWESGVVQVVQCTDSLSEEAHPRNRLPGELSRRVAECIYVPIYDRTGQVSQGVLAVVELLVKRQACDPMVVANAISCLSHIMEALHLSVSNPQAPAHPAAGSGGALARSSQQGSKPEAAAASPTAVAAQAHRQHGAANGGGLGLGRTMSMHTLAS